MAWYSTDWESWNNTSFFGTLILAVTGDDSQTEKHAKSIKTIIPPEIDGYIDPLWNKLAKYEFSNIIVGRLDNEEDLSGYFKTCWDENHFYLLVFVKDNVKSYASVLFDYGWIEDTKGNIIWIMEMDKTKHSGGGFKNRYIDTLIHLKRGQYYLRYQTDESHSPSNWDVEFPKIDFYGIRLTDK